MIIDYHRRFLKNFKKRIAPFPTLDEKFGYRFELFSKDPNDPLLQDHKLAGGKSGFRAFSVTGDIRVIYRRLGSGKVEFYDIGSHNQVY